MDVDALEAAKDDLIAWKLLEPSDFGYSWSRRFRGAVMREAATLAEAERDGTAPSGHPVEVAVREALKKQELPPGAEASPTHEKYLVAVELADLPEAVRNLLGA